MKLLIVDDNDGMRLMIKSVVGELAINTYECSDGIDALASYAEHMPDWVLMDVKMKEMDGVSATRQIKAVYPEAKILIVTDYDDEGLREEARTAGACGYVLKEDLLEIGHRIHELPASFTNH